MQQWIVPIIVAFAAPILTFIVAAWKMSGRIGTSEASKLWDAAEGMREEYRQNYLDCRVHLLECEVEIRKLRNEIQTITARNTILRKENRELRDGKQP